MTYPNKPGNEIFEKLSNTGQGKNEQIRTTAENFLTILRMDKHFSNVRYNLMRGYPEKVIDGRRYPWTDADDAEARTYIESQYQIANRQKYDDAFQVFQHEREYHPVQERLRSIHYDGKLHCESFFIRWMGVDDTPYNREVSRLFFAGGVNRAFSPGSKFDSVLVLIGQQGGGKSTLCRWLSLDDDFFSSVKTISGQKGLESIQGKWIIEIEELLAVLANEKAGQKVEEAAKAFLSTQSDFYRKPYDRRPQDYPRHCVFVGTTNRTEFLTDKTGNRRWFPVRCNQNGRFLYEHESEAKAEILQCWAEMTQAYLRGDSFASPTPKSDLLSEIKSQQTDAEVEDYRVGLIAEYVKHKSKVCLYQIWKEVFHKDAFNVPIMARKDSLELAEILTNQLGWTRGNTENFDGVGRQKSFHAPAKVPEYVPIDDLPVDGLPL